MGGHEFVLYWAGIFAVALSVVAILLSVSGLMTSMLGHNCVIPFVSETLNRLYAALPRSPNATIIPYTNPIPYPNPYQAGPGQPFPNMLDSYFCTSTVMAAAVVRFIFNLFSSLVLLSLGAYMAHNGRKN